MFMFSAGKMVPKISASVVFSKDEVASAKEIFCKAPAWEQTLWCGRCPRCEFSVVEKTGPANWERIWNKASVGLPRHLNRSVLLVGSSRSLNSTALCLLLAMDARSLCVSRCGRAMLSWNISCSARHRLSVTYREEVRGTHGIFEFSVNEMNYTIDYMM